MKCVSNDDNLILQSLNDFYSEHGSVPSEHVIRKMLIDTGFYFESFDVVINKEENIKYVNNVQKRVEDKQIVKIFDIRSMFTKLFALPGFLTKIFNFIGGFHSNSGTISNIMEAKLWKTVLQTENLNRKVLFLPLFLYFDDFEPLNALGSHAGAYKIGASYLGLPFLPEELVSKLEFIFPISLFFSNDRTALGSGNVFLPVINLLNDLSTNGIKVNSSSYNTIKFIPLLILGDNLGSNDILGFTKCFVSNYFCRFCKTIRIVTQSQLYEDPLTLRNETNYLEDLYLNNLTLTGIHVRCIFHQLKHFHVTRNFAIDIMHDFLEGILHYDLCCIIESLIRKRYFTLEELNFEIRHHNYGPYSKNKSLDEITSTMLSKRDLKCSAAEMETFFLHLATIIGHKVKRGAKEWTLYITLRDIHALIFSKTIHKNSHELLAVLVREHHELYLNCFPGETLKPKHHYMLHYPRIMQMIGPISLISSIRYEAYHKKFKNVARTTQCRINLLTTFSKKIEFQFANFLVNYVENDVPPNVGKFENIDLSELKFIFTKYNVSAPIAKSFKTKWIEVCSKTIKIDSVIYIDHQDDELPMFAKVCDILYFNEKYIFCCQKVLNFALDRHFYAYSVTLVDEYFSIEFSHDLFTKVLYIEQINRGNYISLY